MERISFALVVRVARGIDAAATPVAVVTAENESVPLRPCAVPPNVRLIISR